MVAATDGLTVGLPAALKAAGLRDVKIVGQGATPTNLQYMHSGDQAADVAFPYYEVMWSMVNAAAEHEAGVPVTPSVAPPLWVLTPSNAPHQQALPAGARTTSRSSRPSGDWDSQATTAGAPGAAGSGRPRPLCRPARLI